MNKKEQQIQRAKQEDAILTKVLWWIVGAVVLEALLLLLNQVYSHYTPAQIPLALALRHVFTGLAIALPICFVLLLIWAVKARKSGKHAGLSAALAIIVLALAACAVVIRVFDESGIRLLYVAVPAVAVLALIYYLYQREFFFAAVLSALGIPASNAITMFYKQVILQRGLPFEVKLPEHPLDVSRMTAEQLHAELEKGYADIQAERTRPASEVFADIRKEFKSLA